LTKVQEAAGTLETVAVSKDCVEVASLWSVNDWVADEVVCAGPLERELVLVGSDAEAVIEAEALADEEASPIGELGCPDGELLVGPAGTLLEEPGAD
jgi:hypothetical protein